MRLGRDQDSCITILGEPRLVSIPNSRLKDIMSMAQCANTQESLPGNCIGLSADLYQPRPSVYGIYAYVIDP